MTPKQIQDIIDALNHAATYGWTKLVLQQFVVGITEAVVVAFFTIIAIISTVVLVKSVKKLVAGYAASSGGQFEKHLFLAVPAVALIITWFFVFVFTGTDALSHLLNPDGWAIQNIIHPGG